MQETVRSSAWGGASSSGFSFSSVASYCSNNTVSSALLRAHDPSGAVFSSAAPQGLLQLASMALDMRSDGRAFKLKTFAPLAAQSYSDSLTRGSLLIGVPIPEGQPTSGPCGGKQGGATPLETGLSRQQSCAEQSCVEQSCAEAVMAHLELGCPISEADVESMVDY